MNDLVKDFKREQINPLTSIVAMWVQL